MPSYDFKCPACDIEKEVICKIAERADQRCECGSELKQILRGGHAVSAFKNGYFEHIDLEPVYCGSKQQLRAECEKRGLTSQYARD